MSDTIDMQLLREYASRKSESAITELIERHINLVYSVALRFTGNYPDAEDIAQAVFIILARKAASLGARTVVTGWLYETTRLTAMQFLRARARRHLHEQEAYMQTTLENPKTDDPLWSQLGPLLEDAMSRLNEKERTLLALRFFENHSSAESAAALGIGEWAARKKAARALEKLRRYFVRHGINSTTAILEQTIAANSIQMAPATLMKSVTAVATSKGAAASTSTLTLIQGALKVMAWTKAKTAVLIGAGVLVVTGAAIMIMKEVPRHSDLAAIQGTWTGREVGAQGSASLVLQGTKLEFHGANPNEWYKATISLREKTIPKECVVTITDCSDPAYVSKISRSIYRIEGNTLTISGNEPGDFAVPASFDAPDSRTFVFTKASTTGAVATSAIIPVADTNVSDAFSAPPAQSSGSIADWGDVINPDGDCVLNATDGKLTMALPGTDHVLRPERHKMNAPRVLQDVTGEFDLQVKVSGDFAVNAKSLVPGRSPYQDAGLLVWLDDKNNLKLSRARIIVQGRTGDYFNLEFRHEGQVGEIPFPREARQVLRSKTVYLRLQIHSDATTASVSADGNKWFSTTLPGAGRPEKVQAGVLAENNTSSPLNVEFEEFALSKAGNR